MYIIVVVVVMRHSASVEVMEKHCCESMLTLDMMKCTGEQNTPEQ